MKRILFRCGLGLALLSAVVYAAEPAKEAPKQADVDQILAKHVEAQGGKAANLKITSRYLTGAVEVVTFGATAPWQMWQKAPNKQVSITEVEGFGTVSDGYDGKVAWAKFPQAGVREKSGEELAKAKRDAEFHGDLDLKKLYPDLACKGQEKIGEEEVWVLESKPPGGGLERFYLSAKTGLMLRRLSEIETPSGKTSVQTSMEDYRPVGEVKVPFLLRLKMGTAGQQEMEINLKVSEVKHNLEIDDAKFQKPAE
jgi:hypothetical protein